MGKEEALLDYYIVRIYRRQENVDQTRPEAAALIGLVETPGGARQPFHDVQELWCILGEKKPHPNRQPRVEP